MFSFHRRANGRGGSAVGVTCIFYIRRANIATFPPEPRPGVRYPQRMKRSGSRSEATAMALVEAALQIVRESGVKSVTHRKVCSYAGVALGSSTYHYEKLDNLLLDAFAHYVETVSAGYETHFEGVTSDDDLIEAVLGLVDIMTTDMGNAILEWELLAEAGRQEAYRLLGEKWSKRARSAVEQYVSPATAHMIEVIWDGATIQRVFNGPLLTDDILRDLVRAALETDPNRQYPDAPERRPVKKVAKPAKSTRAAKKAATKRPVTSSRRSKAS